MMNKCDTCILNACYESCDNFNKRDKSRSESKIPLIDSPDIKLISFKKLFSDLSWGKFRCPMYVVILDNIFITRDDILKYFESISLNLSFDIIGIIKSYNPPLLLIDILGYPSNFHITNKFMRLDDFLTNVMEDKFNYLKEASETP